MGAAEMLAVETATPKATIRDLYPTPVGVFEWPDSDRMNAELRDAILARVSSSPGIVSSNRNGWHSTWDLHRWPEPCFAEFVERLHQALSLYGSHLVAGSNLVLSQPWQIRKCWANVNPPGGYNQAHHHIGGINLLSGVYYVDLGDCADRNRAGRLILQDRTGVARPKHADPMSREYAITPKPGVAVLFPASLMHGVEPYRGGTRRISIAFDLAHPELEVFYYPDMAEPSWWWRNFRALMLLRTKIPEKARAFARFCSYMTEELNRPRSDVPFMRRLKVTRERAEADEAEARDPISRVYTAEGPLPERRTFFE